MVRTTTLGYPRIGRNRELKQVCEAYWSGKLGEEDLHRTGVTLRRAHWQAQRDAGIDLIPVNDFSFYDQVLDAISLIGAVPERYRWEGGLVDLDTYFAMARGVQRVGLDATAMEMPKWVPVGSNSMNPVSSRTAHRQSWPPFNRPTSCSPHRKERRNCSYRLLSAM